MYYRFIIFVSILLAGNAYGIESTENNHQDPFENLANEEMGQVLAHIQERDSLDSFALTNQRHALIVLTPIRQRRARVERQAERIMTRRRRTGPGGHGNW